MVHAEETVAGDRLGQRDLDRALNLFAFLQEVQRRNSPRVLHVSQYTSDDESLIWLGQLPAHEHIEIRPFDTVESDPQRVLSIRFSERQW